MPGGQTYDAVVVGSGPNGLSAAVKLASSGASVLLLEAEDSIGGGTRTAELTLPGFHHDVCSAVHPTGVLSPYLRTLPLGEHGLSWKSTEVSVAHPLDDEPAVLLVRDLEETARALGPDEAAWRRLMMPFVRQAEDLLADTLGPLRWPAHPLVLLRFGLLAVRSAASLAQAKFRGRRARAAFAGCAAHSILPLETPLTAALGLIFAITAHVEPWPVAEGGSASIARALASYLRSLGGEIRTGVPVRALRELPASRVVLFDTSPAQLAELGEGVLPARYVRRLRRYR